MGDQEVVVGPLLHLGVPCGIELVADLLVSAVEVPHVILIEIGRCNIGTTAEPPDPEICLKVPIVEMHGGAVRVSWMHHRGKTACVEWDLLAWFQLCTDAIHSSVVGSLQGLHRHLAINHTEVATSFFEDIPSSHHPRDPTTRLPTWACVDFFRELRPPVNLLDGRADGLLGVGNYFLESPSDGVRGFRLLAQSLRSNSRRLTTS
mmetsp:Transcript_63031/g.133041  ORF Transcript_63031/g.133041 Transcript_63031/m.133041 type:complete len:205 (+) Transcript_63031:1048-1662(+)